MLSNNILKLIAPLIFFLISCSSIYAQNAENNKEQFLDGIVAIINNDIITFKDIKLELLIQNKLSEKEYDIENLLNRIIDDKLILQDISKFTSSYFFNLNIEVDNELNQLFMLYKSEDNLKNILKHLGLSLNDILIKLKEKKLIFNFLNQRLYSLMKEEKEESLNDIQNQYNNNYSIEQNISVKGKEAYLNYITSLRAHSIIVIKKPSSFIKNQSEIK